MNCREIYIGSSIKCENLRVFYFDERYCNESTISMIHGIIKKEKARIYDSYKNGYYPSNLFKILQRENMPIYLRYTVNAGRKYYCLADIVIGIDDTHYIVGIICLACFGPDFGGVEVIGLVDLKCMRTRTNVFPINDNTCFTVYMPLNLTISIPVV